MSEELELLNPRIKEVMVGTRKLRPVKVYPLSVGDQLGMTDQVAEALIQFFRASGHPDDKLFAGFALNLLRKNFPKILALAVEEDVDTMLNEMDNTQLEEVIRIIWSVNYESLTKNLQGLLGTIKTRLQSKKPSPTSANDMGDTDSMTSSESDSPTGE